MKTKTNDVLIIENMQLEVIPHQSIDTSYFPMVSAFRHDNQLYVCVCLILTENQIESLEVIKITEDIDPFCSHFNIKVDAKTDETKHPYSFTFCVEDKVRHIINESVLVTVTTPEISDSIDPILVDPKTRRGTEVTVQSSTD